MRSQATFYDAALTVALVALPLLAAASDKRLARNEPGEDLDATGLAPLPGYVGEQHPGGH